MKHSPRSTRLLLAICLFCCSSQAQSAGQEPKAPAAEPAASNVRTTDDVTVLRETQQGIDVNEYTGLVWWIPFEFWVQSAQKRGGSPEKTREELNALREYTIVGVFAGKLSSLGSVNYVVPADLQKSTYVRDSEGQDYAAVTDLSADAKTLADVIKPMLSNAMGRAGDNFAILFFPATKKSGKRIADETSKGSFSVVLKNVVGEKESVFLWRTPLTSFSAPRYCPVGKERVHADWDYCPRHGVKLDQQ